jgi:pimeloyl-ACP methyl ester carboxylesterase
MTRKISLVSVASMAAAMISSGAAFQVPYTTKTVIPAKSFTSLDVSTSLMPDSSYTTTAAPKVKTSSNVQLKTYNHDGWTLKYRYKAAAKGKENEPPLLLVHPVGIGMSSWFWDEFLDNWQGGAVYAPDLIGCGIDNGSDAWVPEERGLFFPLSWAKGCETMIQKIILPSSNPISSLLGKKKVAVVTQGGLAPVGVMLAARNPDTVSNLIMTSPPTWNDMTAAVPEAELEKNYNFLRSPLGGLESG